MTSNKNAIFIENDVEYLPSLNLICRSVNCQPVSKFWIVDWTQQCLLVVASDRYVPSSPCRLIEAVARCYCCRQQLLTPVLQSSAASDTKHAQGERDNKGSGLLPPGSPHAQQRGNEREVTAFACRTCRRQPLAAGLFCRGCRQEQRTRRERGKTRDRER